MRRAGQNPTDVEVELFYRHLTKYWETVFSVDFFKCFEKFCKQYFYLTFDNIIMSRQEVFKVTTIFCGNLMLFSMSGHPAYWQYFAQSMSRHWISFCIFSVIPQCPLLCSLIFDMRINVSRIIFCCPGAGHGEQD